MKGKCQKVKHLSSEGAEDHLEQLERVTGKRPNVYQCKKCGFWHVGYSKYTVKLSKKQRRERTRRKANPGRKYESSRRSKKSDHKQYSRKGRRNGGDF